MTDTLVAPRSTPEVRRSPLPFDERMLPELIHGQISKLNELDAIVQTALKAAEKAEERAKAAAELSAGRGFFKDKKKEAIEHLQSAGVDLAEAVQSGAQAQKTAFEFQTRLAEISKYLFSLGVNNVAANRMVVRELEARLKGASEEELSELARQEVLALVTQLKEQEDLLKKQEDLRKKQDLLGQKLDGHELKIKHVFEQVDDQDLRLKAQDAQLQRAACVINEQAALLARQQAEILALQQQVQQQMQQQQARLDTLNAELGTTGAKVEQMAVSLRAAMNHRTLMLGLLAVVLPALLYFVR